MTYRELLQEALESIEWLRLHLERDHACLHMKPAVSGIPDWLNKTEASLRARLAQPEPQREWVGLTDEKLHALHFELKVQTMGGINTLGMYRILEKALREKNG